MCHHGSGTVLQWLQNMWLRKQARLVVRKVPCFIPPLFLFFFPCSFPSSLLSPFGLFSFQSFRPRLASFTLPHSFSLVSPSFRFSHTHTHTHTFSFSIFFFPSPLPLSLSLFFLLSPFLSSVPSFLLSLVSFLFSFLLYLPFVFSLPFLLFFPQALFPFFLPFPLFSFPPWPFKIFPRLSKGGRLTHPYLRYWKATCL